MNVFAVALLLVGSVACRPDKLDGLHSHHHDHHEPVQQQQQYSSELLPAQHVLPAEEEYQGPPQPYSFSYQAGRYPNHVDRTHSESRGTDGVVVGSYEYLDPLQRVVRVDYTADDAGFHPIVQGPTPQQPKDTAAVAFARQKHFDLSAKIAEDQARIAQEHAILRAALDAQKQADLAQQQQLDYGIE